MKIKIICCNDAVELETLVNEFIENKIVHDIKYQSIGFYNKWNNIGAPVNAVANDRVLIMYDDEDFNYVASRIKKGA